MKIYLVGGAVRDLPPGALVLINSIRVNAGGLAPSTLTAASADGSFIIGFDRDAAARRQLHQRGLLRCDWLAALQSPQNR